MSETLLQHAVVAEKALPDAKGADQHFYAGKIAVARFWASEVLPALTLARKQVEKSALDLMELADEAF